MVNKIVNGELKLISTYVDIDTYNKIEKARGLYSKSSFVASVLMDVFSEIPSPKQEV